MFGQDFDVKVWSKDFEFWNLIKICVRTCFFGKQNSTHGSVVPLAMFRECNGYTCRFLNAKYRIYVSGNKISFRMHELLKHLLSMFRSSLCCV